MTQSPSADLDPVISFVIIVLTFVVIFSLLLTVEGDSKRARKAYRSGLPTVYHLKGRSRAVGSLTPRDSAVYQKDNSSDD